MTQEDISHIHSNMMHAIQNVGGRIDQIYYCADVDSLSPNRKPQTGMALQAKAQFPHIKFQESIMVGNRSSDMHFGRNAGMHTVFLATTHPETAFPDETIDYRFDNLWAFANSF